MLSKKLIAIGVYLFFFLIITFVSKKRRMLNTPGYLMIEWWFFLCVAFLILDDMKISYAGIYWIMISTFMYYLGYCFGYNTKVSGVYLFKSVRFRSTTLKTIILTFSVFLIPYGIYGYIKSGGISNVANVAKEYYSSADFERPSFLEAFIPLLSYSVSLFGGAFFSISKNRSKYWALLVFVYPIVSMATSSGKLGVVLSVFLFMIGVLLVSQNDDNMNDKNIVVRLVMKYGVIFLPIVLLLFMSLLWRMGGNDNYLRGVAFKKFVTYAFGSTAAFCDWFTSNEVLSYGLGMNTFAVVPKLLGIIKLQKGVYNALVTTEVWNTNVYTAFRGIIIDFGYFGGIVFNSLIGMVAGVSVKRYKKTESIFSFIVMAMSYLFVFYSMIISPFIYTNLSVLMVFVVISYLVFDLFGGFVKRTCNE